jgi:hypothetical protein
MATDKIQIGLRVSDDLRERIQSAASERGVSINKEITDRLLRSLEEDVSVSPGGRVNGELYAILRVVAAAMDLAGPMAAIMSSLNPDSGKHWINNSIAYSQAMAAAATVLDGFRPLDVTAPHPLSDPSATLGAEIATGILEEAATGLSRTVGPAEMARAAKLNATVGRLVERVARFDARSGKNPGPITVRVSEGVSARLTNKRSRRK